ncbi:23S rRNA (uracil(1939)-C(5))-methyltransferase RlmD [Thermosyntropha sp.]|uniref:23S rRNA (uracil(1939)-C(5))-methyltransferase RlmD n=1 Tax=Thermosyntropha sp. TaxID=2740820 RepID=UPI0025F1DA88|nr:23S rRNA (uracil(1939)-C(5))-methyltransferase RlmD [Thermosyntropha sp.]MBO8158461.1 23S rRNA (uracil(1939)-C(5))-methyltransferase RlmD [Thermosyntropha sp.]
MYCEIEGITHKGEGVGRINGKAVFIPYALPGEKVEIEIVKEKRKFAYARILNILKPSSYRTEPSCSHYYQCGGCHLQHTVYEEQLRIKQRIVEDATARIGKLDVEINGVIGADYPWQYRNKVTWHVKEGKLGYYQPESQNLVEIKTCRLISEDMQRVSWVLSELLQRNEGYGQGEIVLRQSSYSKRIMLIFKNLNLDSNFISALKSQTDAIYFYNRGHLEHIHGDLYLEEKIGDNIFRLSPLSFFQINQKQNEKIIDFVKKALELTGGEKILDAYCGVGSIGLSLADQAGFVLGIENNREATANAEYNAIQNRIKNSRFIAGDCEKILPELHEKFDIAVVDPPRSGLERAVIDVLIKFKPEKILYVSCNPSTLARDLALLTVGGYEIQKIQPFDMFCQTHHVECVVLMSRVEK